MLKFLLLTSLLVFLGGPIQRALEQEQYLEAAFLRDNAGAGCCCI
jgi:hypothetical protein